MADELLDDSAEALTYHLFDDPQTNVHAGQELILPNISLFCRIYFDDRGHKRGVG